MLRPGLIILLVLVFTLQSLVTVADVHSTHTHSHLAISSLTDHSADNVDCQHCCHHLCFHVLTNDQVTTAPEVPRQHYLAPFQVCASPPQSNLFRPPRA